MFRVAVEVFELYAEVVYMSVCFIGTLNEESSSVLRIRDDFIPDPAEFYSGSYYKRNKGKYLKLFQKLFL
jgi:hypothetical protein